MGFGIDRRARSKKAKGGLRALLRRAPDARDVGDRLIRLSRRMFKDSVVDATPRRITLSLHPAASPVRIAVLPGGELEVHAETSAIGPGYHIEVCKRLVSIFDELEYVWDDEGSSDGEPKAAMAAWLAGELRAGATRIGLPAARSFRVECAVQTAMGPRDAAWRDAVIADPARGADAFAWWDRGPGRAARSRALLAMWLDVPWREPLDDAEHALLDRVDADLAAAHRADAELALPWAEWAELLDCLGADDEHAELVRTRGKGQSRTIGYRRHAMDIELSGGWSVVLPGAFVGHWENGEERWWATDGDRVIEFTSLTATDETDSDRLLAVAPEAHPVIARHTDGTHRGRVEVYDDGDIHVVHALMVNAPHVAIVTCKGAASDEPWALAIWRTLRNDSVETGDG